MMIEIARGFALGSHVVQANGWRRDASSNAIWLMPQPSQPSFCIAYTRTVSMLYRW